MKNKNLHAIIFFTVITLAIGLACRAATRLVYADTPVPPTQTPFVPPTDTPTPIPPSPTPEASCPVMLSGVMDATRNDDHNTTLFPNVNTADGDTITLVTYTVNGDQIGNPQLERVPRSLKPYQQDTALQQQAWDLFTTLIPPDQRGFVKNYQIFTDGPRNLLAAVEQAYDDPDDWMLEVDVADIPNTKSLAFTLIHEFGHLLTLNASQVPPDLAIFMDPSDEELYQKEADACPFYFPGEGCSLEQSYVNVFFDRFWPDIYDEWRTIDDIQNDQRRQAKLDALYDKYQDQFVDDYAVTSASEDIAESWAFFVLGPKPNEGNMIAEQKILFFYEYPELAQLRAQIIQNLCAANP